MTGGEGQYNGSAPQPAEEFGSVIADARRYKFSGHQTFPFRYGWLEKGVRAVADSPTIFSDDDALVRLGVGKNMVESIKHWCMVTQLVELDATMKRNNGSFLRVSAIGQHLLSEDGWDPFLENDASLWLVHWLLVSNPAIITTWQVLFSEYHRPDFSRKELLEHMVSFAEKNGARTTTGSIARDVDCFLRTYVQRRLAPKMGALEDTYDCPLTELDLIQDPPDGELYRFIIGPKPSLPSPVMAFALDQYFHSAKAGQSTVSIQQCLYGVGSPGQAFRLDENSLIQYIEEIERLTSGSITLDETAGLKQVFIRDRLDTLGLLDAYYGTVCA
jgi:hypothetical protein